ncbi:Uncharacterised protein [Mycobacterium tuberculosis]|uniref:Uncharacterized protein n=1 Tax=Mycobacterium tuberculosis TaxID=1773 RepID=A0A654ZP25_MYCTX|nr:Uncharacterised protein [Mycobacterium tuberculosis]CKP62946.1 Uncharacterised protein [Mycobacterium tuberculosis]CKS84529.1 Uncharacterised protein [Mycobacterium tuberculosis]CKT67935.1 Uncharacterised protein [Mycobacterium tuberculosis]CNV48327.1 Uncharacterised protein [Mycobacterium tuberculosis]
MKTTAHSNDIQMPSRKYPLDCPTRYAISAHTATPQNPATTGRADSRRKSRHSRINPAMLRANPIAGSKPAALEATTKVTTGNDE